MAQMPTPTKADGDNLPPGTSPELREQYHYVKTKVQALTPAQRQALFAVVATPAMLKSFLANSTMRSHTGLIGPQFEFLAANGTANLWYPGNSQTVPSQWKTTSGQGIVQMCFKYPAASFDPSTGTHGGSWDCEDARDYLISHEEILSGDLFGLASGRVPYVLTKKDITAGKAVKSAGLKAHLSSKITW